MECYGLNWGSMIINVVMFLAIVVGFMWVDAKLSQTEGQCVSSHQVTTYGLGGPGIVKDTATVCDQRAMNGRVSFP